MRIKESCLRNIIRESLCEIMNIDADEYNRYLDYVKQNNMKCKQIADYLGKLGYQATVRDCGNGGNIQVDCVYVSLNDKSEIEIQDTVRKVFPDANFQSGMAGMTITF